LQAGRIVDGPTASNGFIVAVLPGSLQAVVTRLHEEPAVVLAEPLETDKHGDSAPAYWG